MCFLPTHVDGGTLNVELRNGDWKIPKGRVPDLYERVLPPGLNT